jgi:hypothetical protein
MIKKILLISLFSCYFIYANGQDLNAQVQVLSPKVQNTNKRTLEVLQSTIRDFLNNRKWTSYNVQSHERIDCYFVINIVEWDGSSQFKAEAQIRSTRPIYNTSYNSPILALSDPYFSFNYTEGEPLDFTEQQFSSNLSSLLAFYAYLIVGADADSFLPAGGNEFYQKANQIVINAQNSNFPGWGSIEKNDNRYWLNDNLLDRNFLPIREFSYAYHSQVLDQMVNNNSIINSVSILFSALIKVDRFAMGAVYNQVFSTAKSDEFSEMLKLMNTPERLKSISILKEFDPSNAYKYEYLRQNNF